MTDATPPRAASRLRIRSIGAQLSLSYAGIALLTGAILGGILLSVLYSYFGRTETAYLRAAAERVNRTAPRSQTASGYSDWARFAALETRSRVRLVGADGAVLADSGSPDEIDPRTLFLGRDELPHAPDGGRIDVRLPRPLGSGLFASREVERARSNRSISAAVTNPLLPEGSRIVLSEGPASGSDVMRSVAQASFVAALLAVALAALTGWVLSSRIARPIDLLTEASDRMAAGDLSVRADVHRDDEVGRLADSFNTMAERTETNVSALRRFVGDAAHELGTPLTALRADLELAEDQMVNDDDRRLVARALAQSGRLERLSSNLLRLSRIETAAPTEQLAHVDMAEVARQAADAVASRAEQAGLAFGLAVAEGPLPVMAERHQLLVVVENLLDNAVKFTPAGGSVALGARAEGDRVLLWVEDTGVGIPEADVSQVFERFHRARNAASYQGSGLGLSIVRAIVQRHGGDVRLESSDAGSLFEVSLPLASKIPAS